jgi:magnesium chelatase subunit H
MTRKPTSDADATPVRVVVVTLDSHLASACERAAGQLRRILPGLTLSLHAASEWTNDTAALERCRKDIAEGDIILVTMLFMEEHIRAVLPALQAKRESCDAMIACMSAPEVVRLTRMGKLRMGEKAGGMLSFLKRLRGKTDEKGAPQPSTGAAQMKMLRRLPKLLRFIPGTAQDLRVYFLTLQYWLAGSDGNVANMIGLLVDRYASGPRLVLRGKLTVGEPVEYPDVGVYHPKLKNRIGETLATLPRIAAPQGRVGLLVMRSYVLAGNTGHYDGVIAAFEAKGLEVVPAFASGLDARPAIESFFMKDGRAEVDAVVSLTGFSLVGGPAYNDARAAEEILAKLDVPYLSATPIEFQTLEDWRDSDRGLLPVESTMMVAIPELDGATGNMIFGGRSSNPTDGQARDMHPHHERSGMLAARTLKLVSLRRKARADRHVAIVLFNFPPNAGAVGTAAFLGVFESLLNTLKGMKDAGYQVEVPPSVDALRERILGGNSAALGANANVHARISAADHVRREKYLSVIEAARRHPGAG